MTWVVIELSIATQKASNPERLSDNSTFPKEVTGLKLHVMDCGCIYYHRVLRNGDLDPQVGIYRDAEDGPCDVCMGMSEDWRDRVADEVIVYNSKFQVEL